MLTKNVFLFMLIALFAAACSTNTQDRGQSSESAIETPAMQLAKMSDENKAVTPLPTDRKIIKEGMVFFATTDLNGTEIAIKDAIRLYAGYIAEEDIESYDSTSRHIIVAKIPAAQFDAFLATVSNKAGKLDRKEITSEDVTEAYLDAESHIRVKKALEERYFELLQQCKTMDEIIKMEEQLNNVRNDIEITQGRLNYLSNRSSYSSLRITFYEPDAEPVVAKNGFFAKIGKSFASGWNFILMFIIGLVRIWPLFVFIVCGYFIYKKLKSQVRFLKI